MALANQKREAGMYKVKIIDEKKKNNLMEKYYSNKLFEHKANIHGVCTKIFTDNKQIAEMWKENFEEMPEWVRPHTRVFAISDGKRLEVLYEPNSKTVFIKNCDYYGWIKSIALGLVAEFMEDFFSEHRRYSIHGSFIDHNGKGMAIIGPSGSGKTTLTYGILLDRSYNFLTDDWFFVRLFDDSIKVYSSEKNSYIRNDLATNWPKLKNKLVTLTLDNKQRAIIDVKKFFGAKRIVYESSLCLIILLIRDKEMPFLTKLDSKKAIKFMMDNDFCNPHQLLRTTNKIGRRKSFFMNIFKRVPVYLLNTIESPQQSLERLKKIAQEYL
ncbi:MAG: hypothetical protein QW153_03420 [Candidatus Bilamarchaeaceae archaeon]